VNVESLDQLELLDLLELQDLLDHLDSKENVELLVHVAPRETKDGQDCPDFRVFRVFRENPETRDFQVHQDLLACGERVDDVVRPALLAKMAYLATMDQEDHVVLLETMDDLANLDLLDPLDLLEPQDFLEEAHGHSRLVLPLRDLTHTAHTVTILMLVCQHLKS